MAPQVEDVLYEKKEKRRGMAKGRGMIRGWRRHDPALTHSLRVTLVGLAHGDAHMEVAHIEVGLAHGDAHGGSFGRVVDHRLLIMY